MGVVYYKIGRELIKQNKYTKSVCSNPVRRSAPGSSFNILKFIRNRRAFFVCLITVLCYAIGNIPIIVYRILYIAVEYHLLVKYVWIGYLANVLRVAGSHSVNPLIYGTLDKKLLTFWKFWKFLNTYQLCQCSCMWHDKKKRYVFVLFTFGLHLLFTVAIISSCTECLSAISEGWFAHERQYKSGQFQIWTWLGQDQMGARFYVLPKNINV
jgi:hypothetical protein